MSTWLYWLLVIVFGIPAAIALLIIGFMALYVGLMRGGYYR